MKHKHVCLLNGTFSHVGCITNENIENKNLEIFKVKILNVCNMWKWIYHLIKLKVN